MSSVTGDDDPGAAAKRADEIMAGLSALIEADDPGVLDALRAGQAELEDLAARFAGEYWLLPVFLYYQGIIRQERWGRLGDPADRDAAFDLLLLAAENTPEPDEAVVFALLTAAWDRHAQAPSPRAREAFITWGTRMLGRLAADPGTPPGDEDVLLLRRQLALMLCDRAEAGDGDRLADLDRACDLLAVAVESTPEPDPEVVSQLIEAASDRYVRAPSARARDTLITWATWLFGQPAGQRAPAAPFTGEGLTHLRMQLALFLNDRADAGEGDQVTDLAAAIGHYEAVLATRPAGHPERAEVLSFAAHAYWDLIWASGSRDEWLDRMTEHAREAWTAPGLPAQARALIGLCLGLGLREQFSRPGPPPAVAEMNLAVGALSAVLPELRAEDPDLALMAETELGMVLASRGQLTGDLASMREAERHLLSAGARLGPDHPLWPGAVGSLAAAESVLAMAGLGTSHSDQAVTLLRALAERPSADRERAALVDQGLSAVLLARTAGRRGPDADADADEGMKYLKAAFEKAPTGSSARLAIAQNLSSELATRFFMGGSRQDLRAARFYLDVVDEAVSAGPPGALAEAFPDADLLLAGVRGQVALAHGTADGDVTAIRAGVEYLRAAVRLAGPHHPRTLRLRSDLGLALLLRYMYAGEDPADLRDGADELEAAAALLPAEHPMRDMALFRAASAELVLGLRHRDARLLRAGTGRMLQVRAGWGSGPGDPLRVTAMLATAHAQLWELSGDPADLTAARDWYATAAAEFDQQPGSSQHGPLLIGLARLELRAGARKAAVRAGLAALRARARDVLVQAGPAHGLVTARIAAAEAAEVAGWCLDDGAVTAAVEALELGRGLVLHAATSTADLPERLTAAGRPDLAGEWRQLAGQPVADEPWDGVAGPGFAAGLLRAESLAVPSDLRERTLRVLDDDALVTPPDCREIAAALTRDGADALVYLLPSPDASQVHALLVPADGAPRAVPLPPGASGPLDEFTAAQARLLAAAPDADDADDADDAGAPPPDRDAAETEWRDRLDPLCEWAWTAVIGPLLDVAPRPAPGAPPRLVLVPVGRLGVVPWHAACHVTADSGRRYAVADAVFSYAASGRQLAEVSGRRALPLTSAPVIVAPDAGLEFAPVEAAALRGLYPGARYLGSAADGRADGLARPQDVLAVLPAEHDAGASMLHLICHGMATSAGAEASHLLLADHRVLTVKAILRQASGRPPAAPGGLVDLAGCRTHLTAADHDEALTLSTAFLAAGAVTVIGSRWDLPDAPSAVLMFMFHHYLVTGARRPGDALRAAQLWMLDPEREPPASMPPELRDWRWGLDRVVAWAGLTHQGQ